MLPLLAALIFTGLVVVGLALDVGLYAATYRETAFAADVGAEAGAAMIDPGAAYAGRLELDPDAAAATAVEAAASARPRFGRTTAVAVDRRSICVVVTQPYTPKILGAFGVGSGEVSVRACAEPRQG